MPQVSYAVAWHREAGPRLVGSATVEDDALVLLGREPGAQNGEERLVLTGADEIGLQAAEALSATGAAVLLDDRPLRPGEKFADADLIGIPVRVTAGKKSLEDGAVDVKDRSTGAERRVQVSELGTGG